MGFMAFQGLLLLEYWVVLKRTEMCVFVVWTFNTCSPRIRLARKRSFGMMVTRQVWMAHRLASSNNLTRYASAASWRHSTAADWNRRSVLKVLGDLPHQPLEGQLLDEQCCASLVVADVFQSHSPCSVPVRFYQPPLHPCLVDLPLLFCSPVQYVVAQFGSLFRARDVEDWQLPVNWGVKLCPSCVVPCEPLAVLAVHLHPLSSCVCWGHHHHRRRHDLAFCLQTRLHHLYWGRHHCLFLPLHCCDRWLQASYVACPRQSLLPPPVVFFPTFVPSASSRPSLSEESSSP